jgi:ATP-dependent DNA helicase DinG
MLAALPSGPDYRLRGETAAPGAGSTEAEHDPVDAGLPGEDDDDASMGLLADVEMASFFGPEGPIAAASVALGGYEVRASQVAMAEAVQQALLERKHALIEAPTGTGKSLAYLVPAILSGRQVVIATANKSLQAQLYLKDIPFLAQALGIEIDAVVVKGRSNFLCLHKWQNELQEQKQFALYDREHEQVRGIRRWLDQTETGDVDELPFVMGPELRPNVVSFADDCIGRECDFFDECFVEKMRNRAAQAQVVITNHHLLLNALELGMAGERLLPPSSVYVVDEAHGLEQTATAVFETMVTDYTVEQLLARTIFKQLVDKGTLDEDALEELRFQNTLAFQEVKLKSSENSFLIEGELEEIRKLGSRLSELAKAIKENNPFGEPAEGEERGVSQQRQMLARTTELINSTATSLGAVASPRRDGTVVRFAQRVYDRRRVTLELHAAPINPSSLLAKFLFDPLDEGGVAGRMVICTSATLSTAGSFVHFRARCGITSPTIEAVLPPVFDYDRQTLLYQPALPTYDRNNADGYYVSVANEIERLLQVSRGRALCLFTSWSGMQQVAQRLAPKGQAALIWPVRCQGDAPREALLAWFKSTPHSVLLATRSFWEGVDIPGDDLSLVVLDKLPFPTPGDPLTSARMSEVDGAGQNSFGDYMVPLMTLALKQGFGRLIRRTSDRGVVAILDERLTSKAYGRTVRRDLPPARFSRDYRDVHRFFQTALSSDAEFALNLWAWADDDAPQPGAPASGRWQWQLVRLLDGKASMEAGTFTAALPLLSTEATGGAQGEGGAHLAIRAAVEGDLLALSHALADLRGRVERAGRTPAQFSVEVRCRPESAVWLLNEAADVASALPPPASLRQALAAQAEWRTVRVLPVELLADAAPPPPF